jgi:hypothetical protein
MQSKKPLSVIIAATLLLMACTSTYVSTKADGTKENSVRLKESKSVLITTPKDGSYQDKLYNGSGVSVAQKTDTSFSRYAAHVAIYPAEFHSLKELNDTIAKERYDYIVIPTITHWEHRATAWSGLPSRASIKLTILDAQSGKEISSTVVEGKSASFTFLATSPEDLLPGLIDNYVDSLYGQKSVGAIEQ